MENFPFFIMLMAVALLLVGAAQKLGMPYPLALVLGGAGLGFVPELPSLPFDPSMILTLVLPPILYYGAFWTSIREFTRNWFEIFSLALGLVLATTLLIALLFKWLFPDVPWALAFAFGALVSPPDAAAATAILKRFAISGRLLAILEGESLINDAAALVLYKLAIVALLSGMFSWSDASFEFVKTAVGGVAIGALVGLALHLFSHRFLPPVVGVMFSFTIPYITYLIADTLGVSGVLAVVVNGLILSHIYIKYLAAIRRLLAVTSWDIFIILMNCFVFILIGLQLSSITATMQPFEMIKYTSYSLLITFTLIVIRMIWVYTAYGLFFFRVKHNATETRRFSQLFREGAILGWAGMRGIISLAAVLAIPMVYPDGSPLLGRNEAIYITFMVILLTLLIPGFTLPWLLRKLRIHHLPKMHEMSMHRKRLLERAENEIAAFAELSEADRILLLNYFHARHRILEIASQGEQEAIEAARRKILQAQRQTLLQIWDKREIDDKLLKYLELELDLEESLSVRAEVK